MASLASGDELVIAKSMSTSTLQRRKSKSVHGSSDAKNKSSSKKMFFARFFSRKPSGGPVKCFEEIDNHIVSTGSVRTNFNRFLMYLVHTKKPEYEMYRWSVSDVSMFLRANNVSEGTVKKVAAHGINGMKLSEIRAIDLYFIKSADRKKILGLIPQEIKPIDDIHHLSIEDVQVIIKLMDDLAKYRVPDLYNYRLLKEASSDIAVVLYLSMSIFYSMEVTVESQLKVKEIVQECRGLSGSTLISKFLSKLRSLQPLHECEIMYGLAMLNHMARCDESAFYRQGSYLARMAMPYFFLINEFQIKRYKYQNGKDIDVMITKEEREVLISCVKAVIKCKDKAVAALIIERINAIQWSIKPCPICFKGPVKLLDLQMMPPSPRAPKYSLHGSPINWSLIFSPFALQNVMESEVVQAALTNILLCTDGLIPSRDSTAGGSRAAGEPLRSSHSRDPGDTPQLANMQSFIKECAGHIKLFESGVLYVTNYRIFWKETVQHNVRLFQSFPINNLVVEKVPADTFGHKADKSYLYYTVTSGFVNRFVFGFPTKESVNDFIRVAYQNKKYSAALFNRECNLALTYTEPGLPGTDCPGTRLVDFSRLQERNIFVFPQKVMIPSSQSEEELFGLVRRCRTIPFIAYYDSKTKHAIFRHMEFVFAQSRKQEDPRQSTSSRGSSCSPSGSDSGYTSSMDSDTAPIITRQTIAGVDLENALTDDTSGNDRAYNSVKSNYLQAFINNIREEEVATASRLHAKLVIIAHKNHQSAGDELVVKAPLVTRLTQIFKEMLKAKRVAEIGPEVRGEFTRAVKSLMSNALHVARALKKGSIYLLSIKEQTLLIPVIVALVRVFNDPESRTLKGFEDVIENSFVRMAYPFKGGVTYFPQELPQKKSHKLVIVKTEENEAYEISKLNKEVVGADVFTDGLNRSQESAVSVFCFFIHAMYQIVAANPEEFEFTPMLLNFLFKESCSTRFRDFTFSEYLLNEWFNLTKYSPSIWKYLSLFSKLYSCTFLPRNQVTFVSVPYVPFDERVYPAAKERPKGGRDIHFSETGDIYSTVEQVIKRLKRFRVAFSVPSRVSAAVLEMYFSQGYPEEVELSRHMVCSLPYNEALTRCTKIDISYNFFDAVPDILYAAPRLTTLNLSGNDIMLTTPIVHAIASCATQLESLFLDDMNLDYLPSSIAMFTRLRTLSIANNPAIGGQIDALASLTNLRTLDISNVFGTSTGACNQLPRWLGGLKKLHTLAVRGNNICQVDPEVTRGLAALKCLDLSQNRVNGARLRSLTLLENLSVLKLSSCSIRGIFHHVAFHSKLRHLDMSDNKITFVSPALGTLKHLKELYLQNNPLTEVPASIAKLNLTTFVHDKSLFPGCSTLEQEMALARSRIERTLYKSLIHFIGDLRSGKTSLVKGIIKGKEHPSKSCDRHFDLSIYRWDYTKKGQEHSIMLYDYGCMCIKTRFANFMVTDGSIVVYTYDLRKRLADTNFVHWVSAINRLVKDCLVIAVGTHAKELKSPQRKLDEDAQAARANFPTQKIPFFAVDTGSGSGVSSFKKALKGIFAGSCPSLPKEQVRAHELPISLPESCADLLGICSAASYELRRSKANDFLVDLADYKEILSCSGVTAADMDTALRVARFFELVRLWDGSSSLGHKALINPQYIFEFLLEAVSHRGSCMMTVGEFRERFSSRKKEFVDMVIDLFDTYQLATPFKILPDDTPETAPLVHTLNALMEFYQPIPEQYLEYASRIRYIINDDERKDSSSGEDDSGKRDVGFASSQSSSDHSDGDGGTPAVAWKWSEYNTCPWESVSSFSSSDSRVSDDASTEYRARGSSPLSPSRRRDFPDNEYFYFWLFVKMERPRQAYDDFFSKPNITQTFFQTRSALLWPKVKIMGLLVRLVEVVEVWENGIIFTPGIPFVKSKYCLEFDDAVVTLSAVHQDSLLVNFEEKYFFAVLSDIIKQHIKLEKKLTCVYSWCPCCRTADGPRERVTNKTLLGILRQGKKTTYTCQRTKRPYQIELIEPLCFWELLGGARFDHITCDQLSGLSVFCRSTEYVMMTGKLQVRSVDERALLEETERELRRGDSLTGYKHGGSVIQVTLVIPLSHDTSYVPVVRELKKDRKAASEHLLSPFGLTLVPFLAFVSGCIDNCHTLQDFLTDDAVYGAQYVPSLVQGLAALLTAFHSRSVIMRSLKSSDLVVSLVSASKCVPKLVNVTMMSSHEMKDEIAVDKFTVYTAPETLATGYTTVKTDVFSFGLLLNEIFTRDVLPSETYTLNNIRTCHDQFREAIAKSAEQNKVYKLIQRCIDKDPNLRPSAKEIYMYFSK